MNGGQAGQTPILGRKGLLRLLEVVERLRARARGEEGGSSWTTKWAVDQPGEALVIEPSAPAAHAVRVHADPPGDLPVGQAVSGQQHDPGAGDVALRGGMAADAPLEFGAFSVGQEQRWQGRHPCPPWWKRGLNRTRKTSAGLH
jgi:hypothetical protein